MTQPLVTVIVNSYNRPKLIRDALGSILAQTWPNIQMIVADDWSNAETLLVVDSYRGCLYDWPFRAAHYREWCKCVEGMFSVVQPKLEPTAHERQYGQRCSICINAVMPYANGDFVCYLPDDDFLTPWSIEVRAQYLIDNPTVNAVYGRLEACHSYNPVDGVHWGFPPLGGKCFHDRNGFWSAEPIMRAANKVDHGMMMVRRVPNLPEWPEYRTDEAIDNGVSTEVPMPPSDLERFVHTNGERFDCPDAGFLYRLELAGLGPFHSVNEVVVVKRYHAMHHRTDPSRRE